MLGIYCDLRNFAMVPYNNESYGLPSTCNQKGYKIPFTKIRSHMLTKEGA